MKSSNSWALAAAVILVLSLGLKVFASPFANHRSAPVPRTEQLHRFLVAAVGEPVEPIAGGWRFRSGRCQLLAFPSGPRGTLDMAATANARRRDRIAYVYRGRVLASPPATPLAIDVIAYNLRRPFRAANEPGYVVLISPKACAAFPNLPWGQLPIT